MLAKELLEPIRPIAECMQGRLQEVYFGFQKVGEVKQHYQALREDVDKEHDRIYWKALLLTDKIGEEERMTRIIPGRQSRPNREVQSPKDYWRVTVTIPFLDSIITELESRLGSEKRAHCKLCALIPEVLREVKREKLSAIASALQLKWKHLMPYEDTFGSELFRWKNHCEGLKEAKSITRLLCEDADPVFFPNVRELLCILAVLPVGSAEAERSFSCLRHIYSWLRTTMMEERLGRIGVLVFHGFKVPLNIEKICDTFIRCNPRRMSSRPVLFE